MNSILKILQAKKLKIALAAPTGRAAKRLSDCTSMEAKTLHRLLETNPTKGGFSKNEENPLDCDLLIIDGYHARIRVIKRHKEQKIL